MAKTSRKVQKHLFGAVRIDPDWLQRWFASLADLGLDDIDISVTTEGNRSITDLSLDELFALRSGKSDRIKNVTIQASRKLSFTEPETRDRLYVTFNSDAASTYFSVSGGEKDVAWASEVLMPQLDDLKPWYHGVTRVTLAVQMTAAFALLICLYALPNALLARGIMPKEFPFMSTTMIAVVGGIVFGFGALAGVFIGIGHLSERLFPRFEVLIGEGVKRHEQLADLRKTLFWSVIVTIVVSVAIAAISKVLGLI